MKMKRLKAITSTKAFWSSICGLIIGGMIGGITQSIPAFLLFGIAGFAYSYSDFFHVATGVAVARHHTQSCCEGNDSIVNNNSDTDAPSSMPEDYYLTTLNSELDFTIVK